jgi:Putative auto-transporter adhesin, head GIN domain
MRAPVGLLVLLLPACVEIYDGDGVPGEDMRMLSGFEGVATQGNLDLVVTQGEAFSIEVRIDQNLVQRVSTTVSGDTLKVAIDGGNLGEFRPGPHVLISMPTLTEAELRGPGSLKATGFDDGDDVSLRLLGAGVMSWSGKADALEATLEGTAELTLDGTADSADLYLRGSGTIDARELQADAAIINVDGSGSIVATVDGPVDVSAAGTSSVELYGDVVQGNYVPTGDASIVAH